MEPDLALIDISLPGKNGLEMIKDLRAMESGVSILVHSMHDESLYVERVLRAGAQGYIMKDEGGIKLMEAIRKVLAGEIYVRPPRCPGKSWRSSRGVAQVPPIPSKP